MRNGAGGGSPERPGSPRIPSGWVIATILILAALVRIRLLEVPLQRDEGEYAYAGQLLLQGHSPYQWAYHMKLPGIHTVYAVIMAIFGQTTRAIHFGLLLTNSATIFLLYRLGRALVSSTVGLVAAAIFALLSLSWAVQGFSSNAEHFVLLPVLAGLILLLRATQPQRGELPPCARLRRSQTLFFTSGLLLGAGFLIKQHGVVFILMAGCYLAVDSARSRPRQWKSTGVSLLLLAAGVLLPYGIMCLMILVAGTFETFWLWTTQYAAAYIDPSTAASTVKRLGFRAGRLYQVAPAVWWMILLGLFSLPWNRALGRGRAFIALLVVFSLVAIFLGLHFRAHYFILLLPGAALLGGAAVVLPARTLAVRGLGWVPAGIAVAALLASVMGEREFLFEMTPEQINRMTYPDNFFVEAERIGAYVRENSKPDATIAILGSEPEIYFHARRRSATGHIYMYPLMEDQPYALQMQKEMAREIEAAAPEFVVNVSVPISWLRTPSSQSMIFEWFVTELLNRYELVGVTTLDSNASRHYFAPDPMPRQVRAKHWVSILRRRDLGS